MMRWVTLPSGKRIPLDRHPDDVNGNIAVVTVAGVLKLAVIVNGNEPLARLRQAGEPLYRTHWDTCPEARIHRNRQAGE